MQSNKLNFFALGGKGSAAAERGMRVCFLLTSWILLNFSTT
jgi:hypothetical protein